MRINFFLHLLSLRYYIKRRILEVCFVLTFVIVLNFNWIFNKTFPRDDAPYYIEENLGNSHFLVMKNLELIFTLKTKSFVYIIVIDCSFWLCSVKNKCSKLNKLKYYVTFDDKYWKATGRAGAATAVEAPMSATATSTAWILSR